MASYKCPSCGKPSKENTEGNMRYCQSHSFTSGSMLTRNIRPVREVEQRHSPGDYIRLNNEEHVYVDKVLRRIRKNIYKVFDQYGEDRYIERNPSDDNDLRNAWKIREN